MLLAMPLLRENKFDPSKVVDRLKSFWGLSVTEIEFRDTKTGLFCIGKHQVVMMHMGIPVPRNEFQSLFPVSPYWENAEDETAESQSHVIVTLLSSDETPLERYSLFTKVIESVLAENDSLGVYQGDQTLLISKENYMQMSNMFKEDSDLIPVLLWIFIGIGKSDKGVSLYTYGLERFGKKEMEIIDSQQDGDDLYYFLVNICAYVIQNDITFKEGETLGYTEEVAAKLSISKGVFHEGETIKMKM